MVGALAALLLKKNTPELGLLLGVTIALTALLSLVTLLQPVLDFWRELEELSGLSGAVTAPLLKCVGIALMTKIAAELCRDAKETAVAGALEIAGTVTALYLSLPLLSAVLKLIRGLI